MANQVTHTENCRLCGAALTEEENSLEGVCDSCAASDARAASVNASAHSPIEAAPYGAPPLSQSAPPYPDNPQWGPAAGIGAWLASVGAMLIIPSIAVLGYYFMQRNAGAPVPEPTDKEAFTAWFQSTKPVLVMIAFTFVAHLITLAICWLVVTRVRARPFWSSLGWHWGGKNFGYWLIASLIIIYVILGMDQVFVKLLPQSRTPFDDVLDTSEQVRWAVAAMAVISAPLIEELVYRGVLFSGLRKKFSMWTTVALVTLLFAGVHAPQYWGAWASMAGLTLLSFVMTTIRALSRSVLPCVLIHTLYNTVGAIAIVKRGQEEMWLNIFTAAMLYVLLLWYFFIRRREVASES